MAFAADPDAGASVPLIGFRIVKGLSQLVDATVVGHRRDEAALADKLPSERLRFVGSRRFSTSWRRITSALFPGKWGLISMLELPDQLVFDLHAWWVIRRLIRSGEADIVLRVNPVSIRVPSLLARLTVPVFTGPHNGGMNWPPAFQFLDAKERTGQRYRWVGDLLHKIYGDTARYAGILVANDGCAETLPREHRGRVMLFSENGVQRLSPTSEFAGDASRLLYVGRLTPFKAVDVVIRAMARLPDHVRLTIVGDGPQRQELEALAIGLGVATRCRFEGARPHEELATIYSQAGVFVFPSVRESGGSVVLEAMSHGLPCVVAKWGGPFTYTATTGAHLSVDSPAALEDGLVATITSFLQDPASARHIGEKSRAVVQEEYVWANKIERLWGLLLQATMNQTRAAAEPSTPPPPAA